MVTKEKTKQKQNKSKQKNKHLKERQTEEEKKLLLTKTHFSGETMIQRKKKQRNKLFYIQQHKTNGFSE